MRRWRRRAGRQRIKIDLHRGLAPSTPLQTHTKTTGARQFGCAAARPIPSAALAQQGGQGCVKLTSAAAAGGGMKESLGEKKCCVAGASCTPRAPRLPPESKVLVVWFEAAFCCWRQAAQYGRRPSLPRAASLVQPSVLHGCTPERARTSSFRQPSCCAQPSPPPALSNPRAPACAEQN